MEQIERSSFDIYLHDVKYTVNAADITPETTLNDYLRNIMGVTGTKVMCREGGCGVCIVAVTVNNPDEEHRSFAVNSCLVYLYSCSGWKISTIEGIGNAKIGYHPIQKDLAFFNGTQCGFCSPGMVMNMYALYQKGNLKMEEIENSFGGNICRCTGYRPILAAFKQYAVDFDQSNIGFVTDIEDYPKCKQDVCENTCLTRCEYKKSVYYSFGRSKWYKVHTINEIINIFMTNSNKDCRLVAGNTAHGVYKSFANAEIYIDIANVHELIFHKMGTKNFTIGGGVNLTDTISLFKTASTNQNYSHLAKMAEHIELVAHVPVRNIGTIAGNLSIKHKYNEFPSDIFLILETAGAMIIIVDKFENETRLRPSDYLKYDMKQKVIKCVSIPALDSSYKYESYKIMPRAQNAHAMLNAGFLFKFNTNKTIEKARIVFGGINPKFIHADQSESYLHGKNLFDNVVMQTLFTKLSSEIKSDHVLPDPSARFRDQLAIALCYKFILSIAPNVSADKKSGGKKLVRPLSKGTQDFTTQKSMYPLTEPVLKIEAQAQTSGEGKYIIDIPDYPNQTYGAFVLANAPAKSVIKNVDASLALKLDGVIAYIDQKDIPGKNTFTAAGVSGIFISEDEELFCSGTVKYYFQPIGLIVAKSQLIAEKGAALVKINYQVSNEKIYFTIQSAIKDKKFVPVTSIKPTRTGNDIKHVVSGTTNISWQYHFHMETQNCVAVPIENGEFDLYPATQWMDLAQCAGAICLNIPLNKINIQVRRLGGSYGAKISRNTLVSCAALVACNAIQKPVKIWMPFIDNMNAIGKRHPNYSTFSNSVDDKGVIQTLKLTTYSDFGVHINDYPIKAIENMLKYTYNSDTFDIDINLTRTDNSPSAWTRAPGSAEGTAILESIMEHTAYATNIDPFDIRLANISDKNLIKCMNDMKTWSNLDKLKTDIMTFNKENRWRKRGISVVPMVFQLSFIGTQNIILSVYDDGSVAISHSGIEMGQGINTKVVQVAAYYLGISMDLITCQPSNNLVSPNAFVTGGSITSEALCLTTKLACEELSTRMADIRKENPGADWKSLVKLSIAKQINLSVATMFDGTADSYKIYGVATSEIEIDILTGNFNITRVHLIEDVGDSISPLIDIGQIEGAFIMGLGYYTSEEIILDPNTGELKNNRTWNYKPPGAKDIPIEFKVKLPSNNPNPSSPLKTKATGEPPLCLSIGIPLAIKNAIKYARLDADKNNDPWYTFDGPCTVESNFLNSLNDYKQYTL